MDLAFVKFVKMNLNLLQCNTDAGCTEERRITLSEQIGRRICEQMVSCPKFSPETTEALLECLMSASTLQSKDRQQIIESVTAHTSNACHPTATSQQKQPKQMHNWLHNYLPSSIWALILSDRVDKLQLFAKLGKFISDSGIERANEHLFAHAVKNELAEAGRFV